MNLSDLPDTVARASQAAATPAVVFSKLAKQYLAATGPVTALRDIDFQIEAGEVFGIIGRSGAGKSTLLRTINRLEAPSSGQVRVHGKDIAPLNEDGLVDLRRGIGMIFQHFNLMSAKTVAQNVALPLRVAGVRRADIGPRVDFLLDLVGLSDKRDVYPAKLSGGQKQRVGIARALVHEPAILLCDEATSALDPETTQSILALLRDINRRLGLTIILITHEMAVIRETCDRVAVLEQGKVVELGEVWKVFGNPQSAATQALLQPLVHDLPDELRQGLQPASPQTALTPSTRVLLDFRLTGEAGREFDLGALSQRVGGSLELLHGGVDRLRGRAHGRVVVGVRTRLPDVAALCAAVDGIADQVQVLGLHRSDAA